MKRILYVLFLPLLIVSGLVFANREKQKEPVKRSTPKAPSAAEREAILKQWEATPDGIRYTTWKASPEGQKVVAGAAKIRKQTKAFTNMEAVVTSLSLPPGSRLGFGVMASIDGVDYILIFDPEKSQLEQLRSLKVSDRIIIKSRTVSHAPKYSYPIISCEYAERDGQLIYKRVRRKGGC